MTKILKTIITLTILHREDEPMDGRTLAQIGYEIDEGGAVGMMQMTSQEPVPLAQVPDELKALGNDGEFFDLENGDYTEKTNKEILESYGYKLVTREEFDKADDVPEGLRERAATTEGTGPFIIYDPNDDDEGWFLSGDNAEELARETVEHRCTD